jgi:branched-chain amino acid transport system ATP-binding protein
VSGGVGRTRGDIGLKTIGLGKRYGGLTVAKDVNLELAPGDRTALIGPNGAGKSTFAGLVTGAITPTSGRITLDGHDITGLSTARRVKAGIVKTFQITTLLASFTPREHVRLTLLEKSNRGLRLLRDAASYRDIEDGTQATLDRLGLTDEADVPVEHLPYGKQRMTEFALGLALEPRILILDEPAAGVPSGETQLIVQAIKALPKDLAVLIIEHDMDLVFSFATKIIVLVAGMILTTGTPAEIAADPRVQKLYLGDYLAAE